MEFQSLPLNVETACKPDDKSMVDVLCTTPTSHQKCKRRRIVEETSNSEVEKPKHCGSNGFVPASKLMQTYAPWLEVPRPSPSFASTSASSSLCQSGPSSSHSRLLNAAAYNTKLGLATDSMVQPSSHRTSRKRERPSRSATSTISSSPSKCTKTRDVAVSQPQTGASQCIGPGKPESRISHFVLVALLLFIFSNCCCRVSCLKCCRYAYTISKLYS